MMIFAFVTAWVALGMIGAAVSLEFGFRRDGLDITTDDVFFALVVATIFGPANLVVATVYVIGWLLPKGGGRRVVFKAHKKS